MERYVEWKPFYSVGDTVIDEQHKRLLNMVDNLYLASQMNHDAAQGASGGGAIGGIHHEPLRARGAGDVGVRLSRL